MKRTTVPTIALAWSCFWLGGPFDPSPTARAEGPAAIAGPAVPAAAVGDGLELWVKADDLVGLKEGDPVGTWPDSSGRGRHLTSAGPARPHFKAAGIAGRPSVAFAGDIRTDPRVAHWFSLPLVGEWKGVSVFAVGKGLGGAGWLDTAPGGPGCLRAMRFLQLTGGRAGHEGFKGLDDPDRPGLAELLVGIDDRGAMNLSAYANGRIEGRPARDEGAESGVIFRDARIGVNNRGEAAFSGELAEMLIYRGVLAEGDRRAVERYLMTKYGLAETRPDDPKGPPGLARTGRAGGPPPAVGRRPFAGGLRLWARADDIPDRPDGSPVGEWANAAGDGRPLTAEGDHRPRFGRAALNGRPVVRFGGDLDADPRVVQMLKLPLDGEWPELTLIVAGRHLDRPGVFDGAPGRTGCLRTMGFLQLTGSSIGIDRPFPSIAYDDGPATIAIEVRADGPGGRGVATFADGHRQSEARADGAPAVRLLDPKIGSINLGEKAFRGEIAEVLVYDRALGDADRRQTEDYLMEKWGIPPRSPDHSRREADARSRWTMRARQLPRSFSWFGNSFSGKDEWVQSAINGLAVLPDGTVVATCVWDEPHKEIGFYKDGRALGRGAAGGSSKITTDGTYFYAGLHGMGKLHVGVWRLTRDLAPAPWPGMKPGEWPLIDIKEPWLGVRGIGVVGGEIFATVEGRDDVQVFDAATGRRLRGFEVKGAGPVAVGPDGMLWIGVPDGVAQYTTRGKPTGKAVPGVKAGDLAFDPRGVLVVADAGARQQVISFDVSGERPRETRAIGEPGGVWAGPRPGATGEGRLVDPNAVGVDRAGNVYVNGSGSLRSYAPDGRRLWELECTQFCTTGDLDPATDGRDLYTAAHHYRQAPGRPPGRDWTWVGFTSDPRRFPEIGDRAQQVLLRRLGGHLIRYSLAEPIAIHRLEPDSEIFIPCGAYHQSEFRAMKRPPEAPKDGRYFWSDGDGDGRVAAGEIARPRKDARPTAEFHDTFVDDAGTIWQPQGRRGLRRLPLKGVTAKGVPTYDLADEVDEQRPPEFSEVLRAQYFPRSDTMYLAGYTWEQPARGSEHWGNCGREVVRYDDWGKPTRKVRCRMPYPEGATNIKAIGVAPRANRLFAGEMETSVVFVYDTTDGRLTGIVEPDKDLVGDVGWIDIGAGVRAFEREGGEILLVVEDSWAQKQMVYRLPGGADPKD